jgi:hypothetical protein
MLGMAMIAGVGFTMSLFVGALAFYGNAALEAPIRLGVLGGSAASAVLGLIVLQMLLPKDGQPPLNPELAAQEDLTEAAGILDDLDGSQADAPARFQHRHNQ